MYVAAVVKHYGSLNEAAKVLGISRIAVRKWDDVVPAESAIRLQQKSGGALKVDAAAYDRLAQKRNRKMARQASARVSA
jgi:hypothetical protein